MSNRSRGDYHERRTREDLETHGWLVIRSGGSLGPADLVALHHSRPPIFVNCKLNGILRDDEHDKTFVAALRAGAIPLLAMRESPGAIVYRAMTKPRTYRGKLFLDDWLRRHRRDEPPLLRLVSDGEQISPES